MTDTTQQISQDVARINALCSVITSAETLNSLHACRPGHPLGRGNAYKWRNAWFSVAGNSAAVFHADSRDLAWLQARALAEGRAS